MGRVQEWGCCAEMATRSVCKEPLSLWPNTELHVSRMRLSES